jgi:ribosomal protein S19
LINLTDAKQKFYSRKRLVLHSNFELKYNLRKFYILDSFLNFSFFIHNGKSFDTVRVDKNKIGFKFGDFSITKKYQPYSSKK